MAQKVILLIIIVLCLNCQQPKYTAIKFEEKSINLGKVAYKSDVEIHFKYKNIGNSSLKITGIELSCDCLYADWSRNQTRVNDSCFILVKPDTKVLGPFFNKIKVHFNGQDSPVILFLSGTIVFKKKGDH